MSAYEILSRCRQSGFGFSPISFTDISSFADRYEIEDFDTFVFAIQTLDTAYREYGERKAQSKAEANKSSKPKNLGKPK